MRVLYFGFNNPRIHARGVEFVIQSQAAASERGYYFFLGNTTTAFKWGKLACISVKRSFFWPVLLNLLVLRLLRSNPNTLIHSHNYLMGIALLRRIDVFTVHDGLAYLKQAMGSRSRIWHHLECIAYKKTKIIHFISDYARSKAASSSRLRRTITIYNTCPRDSTTTSRLATSQTSSTHKPYALIVRSIEDRAGLELIVDVASSFMKSQNEQLDFVIAGKGPLLELYRKRVKDLGLLNIHFLSYVSDLQLIDLYRNARLTITPALYGEGFGLPVIESYYFGKEAIASDVCALPEILINKVFLFNNTPADLRKKIQDILSKQISTNPDECHRYYEQKFGAHQYRRRFLEVYKELSNE